MGRKCINKLRIGLDLFLMFILLHMPPDSYLILNGLGFES